MKQKPNPIVAWVNRRYDSLVRFLGDLKYYKVPPVIVWDPGGYQVKGEDERKAMALVEPGDVLVRGYLGYVDGAIIPGYFSHAGLYLGEVKESDRALCAELARSTARWRGTSRTRPRLPNEQFAAGSEMVVHALAEGVMVQDLLDFCRCDYMAILRLPDVLHGSPTARRIEGLGPEEQRIDARLRAGEGVPRADVVPVMRKVALSKVGYPYDTTFDFTDMSRLSCTELVYTATRCLSSALDVAPKEQRFAWVLKHTIMAPDEYVRSSVFRPMWKSRSVDEKSWGELRAAAAVPDAAARSAKVA